jgi:hypothetical protein
MLDGTVWWARSWDDDWIWGFGVDRTHEPVDEDAVGTLLELLPTFGNHWLRRI